MKETGGKAPLVNSWIKTRTILHGHPQLSKSLNCETLCSHENSAKSCESRKSEFSPMWKCRTDSKFTRYQQDAKKAWKKDREMRLAGNTEISYLHGTEDSDRNAAQSQHPDFWEQMYSQEHTRKLEVPHAGQMQSSISEVWWTDVIAQSRKCWPSNKQTMKIYSIPRRFLKEPGKGLFITRHTNYLIVADKYSDQEVVGELSDETQ